jgi:arylsulfatase A-like enzyme
MGAWPISLTAAPGQRPGLGKGAIAGLICASAAAAPCSGAGFAPQANAQRPDILLVITDDMSHAHWSGAGCTWVRTPNLDALAERSVVFRNAYVQSPSCAPSRASLLTGRSPWQLGPGMVLWGDFPAQFPTYPSLLAREGYARARFGKGWGPGRGFLDNNPAGPSRDNIRREYPTTDWGYDTPADFAAFLDSLKPGEPYCVWWGAEEPHRPYVDDAWKKAGIDPARIPVPPFLPDTPEVRKDLANYAAEIEFFDSQLGLVLETLRKRGRLDNTLVVVTSDNGMPFPRAKVTCYDYGIHVPLVVSWPAKVPGGRKVDDFVTTTDLMPTILAATGLDPPPGITGRSLLPLLKSNQSGQVNPEWTRVAAGIERHDFGYHSPERALRSGNLLYMRHISPDKPKALGGKSPSHEAVAALRPGDPLYDLYAMRQGKMPAEELFDLARDPFCMNNLATDPKRSGDVKRLSAELDEILVREGDPRTRGLGYIFGFFPTFKFREETDYHWEVLPARDDSSK